MNPAIPPGYRRLPVGEIYQDGDYFMMSIHSGGSTDLRNWIKVLGLAGSRVEQLAIRPGEPTPPPEKEWLNPWD